MAFGHPPSCLHSEQSQSRAGGAREGHRLQVRETRGSARKLGESSFQSHGQDFPGSPAFQTALPVQGARV